MYQLCQGKWAKQRCFQIVEGPRGPRPTCSRWFTLRQNCHTLSLPNHLPIKPATEPQLAWLSRATSQNSHEPLTASQSWLCLGLSYRRWVVCVLFRDVYSWSSRDNLEDSQAVIYLRQKSMTSSWNPSAFPEGHSNLYFGIFLHVACQVRN